MIILDFSQSAGSAFFRGAIKGLGAPLSLYGKFMPPPLPAFPATNSIRGRGARGARHARRAESSVQRSLAQDWQRVGADMRVAMTQYGEAEASAK